MLGGYDERRKILPKQFVSVVRHELAWVNIKAPTEIGLCCLRCKPAGLNNRDIFETTTHVYWFLYCTLYLVTGEEVRFLFLFPVTFFVHIRSPSPPLLPDLFTARNSCRGPSRTNDGVSNSIVFWYAASKVLPRFIFLGDGVAYRSMQT